MGFAGREGRGGVVETGGCEEYILGVEGVWIGRGV